MHQSLALSVSFLLRAPHSSSAKIITGFSLLTLMQGCELLHPRNALQQSGQSSFLISMISTDMVKTVLLYSAPSGLQVHVGLVQQVVSNAC